MKSTYRNWHRSLTNSKKKTLSGIVVRKMPNGNMGITIHNDEGERLEIELNQYLTSLFMLHYDKSIRGLEVRRGSYAGLSDDGLSDDQNK